MHRIWSSCFIFLCGLVALNICLSGGNVRWNYLVQNIRINCGINKANYYGGLNHANKLVQNKSCFQFNFVGKLLGPKGNSMKRLQEETMTKMAVLGRGSMRDKQKVGFIIYYFSD